MTKPGDRGLGARTSRDLLERGMTTPHIILKHRRNRGFAIAQSIHFSPVHELGSGGRNETNVGVWVSLTRLRFRRNGRARVGHCVVLMVRVEGERLVQGHRCSCAGHRSHGYHGHCEKIICHCEGPICPKLSRWIRSLTEIIQRIMPGKLTTGRFRPEMRICLTRSSTDVSIECRRAKSVTCECAGARVSPGLGLLACGRH
ncbi:hypothetical protein DB88DRAFT_493405 [Papiliotrema laurentii]|uniref:Uncharacterized protein n=1 Tax=Papiliotrema laurentii TaxID=5418 RepID=A0AAD9FPN0_PAPLA|nr:hypothetical protein DB88DRAFT_493405 [Papiliotrema laurentii]